MPNCLATRSALFLAFSLLATMLELRIPATLLALLAVACGMARIGETSEGEKG
jgi:hypothetical protein